MQANDAHQLFRKAEQSYLAGRLDAARSDLLRFEQQAGEQVAALHLLGLVEKKSGNLASARLAFERAVAIGPVDAPLASNFANLLSQVGDHEEAYSRYTQALKLAPNFHDARYNRALLSQKFGRLEEALAELDFILSAGRADAKIHSARGSVLFQLDRIDDAAKAYDEALRFQPDRLRALQGRAHIAMARGEGEAVDLYIRALQQDPGAPDLVMGLAEALEAKGDPLGIELLADAARVRPDWLGGQECLARMRYEAGDHTSFADHYADALKARPQDKNLHFSYWSSLARAEQYSRALEAVERAAKLFAGDQNILLQQAIFTAESGNPSAALQLLRQSPDTIADTNFTFSEARICLQAGEITQAEQLFEQVTRDDPTMINGWAHLDLCWRLTGDERHHWLSRQPGLFGCQNIGLDVDELEAVAALLRNLHRTRAHPIGQSLRGGTQTRGRLFWRIEPEIKRLRQKILEAVQRHFDALPGEDPRHPLLRHRNRTPYIEGSWSVRLTSGGFHVSHIHPEGILSSACYLSLPANLKDDTKEGWLEIGRPPAAVGVDLEPLAIIEPRPALLALFPSYLFHGTRAFDEGERLTVAFDVLTR
jgi:tetratricopeptide (TPR) repeat protein